MESVFRITADEDFITIELDSGLQRVLIPPHAETLLQSVVEYSRKQGRRDIKLSPFRSLTVRGTESDVAFSFFSSGQSPNDWVLVRDDEVDRFIAELREALGRFHS